MTDIEKIPKNVLILYLSFKIKDKQMQEAFKEAARQLYLNKDIAELANGIINGMITL